MNDESSFEVRFGVSYEAGRPVLSHLPSGPFVAYVIPSRDKDGMRFENMRRLMDALDSVGLPGEEICTFTDKTYGVTAAQLLALRSKAQRN